MKSPKFYKTIIAILVIVNISMLAFMWFGKPPHPPKPGEHKISNELGITGPSKKIADELEKEHHKEKRKLVDLDVDLHTKLYKGIGSEIDSEAILNEIDSNKRELEEMTFSFFDEIANLCNDSQKEELKKFVEHHLNNLRPGPPRPPKK